MKKVLNIMNSTTGATVLCALLGFLGSICMVPSSGILTALPLLPAIAVAAAFINLSVFTKAAIFALFGGLLNAVYFSSNIDIAVYAAVCGFSVLLACMAKNFFKNKKLRFWAVIPFAAIFALQMFFGGNIVSYIRSSSVLKNYVNLTYTGEYEKTSGMEYHYISRTWRINIVNKNDVTVKGSVVAHGDVATDNYVNRAEEHALSNLRTEIAGVLRKSFAGHSFNVVAEKLYGFNVKEPQAVNRKNAVFCVYIEKMATPDEFLKLCNKYRNALNEANLSDVKIIFRGRTLAIYDMEEVYYPLNLKPAKVKYYCGAVLPFLQDRLDNYFADNTFKYN